MDTVSPRIEARGCFGQSQVFGGEKVPPELNVDTHGRPSKTEWSELNDRIGYVSFRLNHIRARTCIISAPV